MQEGAGQRGVSGHLLSDEGGVPPLLASCLGQLNSQKALESGTQSVAWWLTVLPHPSRVRRGGGEDGGWCAAWPGVWGRGPLRCIPQPCAPLGRRSHSGGCACPEYFFS